MSVFVLGGQALSIIPAAAAAPPPGPVVVQSLKNDRSAPLRDEQQGQVGPNNQRSHPYRALRPRNSNAKGPSSAGPVQTAPGTAAMPGTSTNWEGVNNIDGVLPPDPNGDVGPNNYVQWVNLHYQIWSKTGVSLLGPSAGNTLWAGFGGVCQTTNQGDPVVRHDRMADRWIFTQFAFNVDSGGNPVAPYIQCFAVSTTSDPTGAYYRYAFQISNVNFNDYPKLAIWPDAFYMTFNYFDLSLPLAQQFQGAGAWAFDRSKMLSGQPATGVTFTTSAAYGGLLPSDLDSSILPPAGSPNYVAGIDTNVAPSGSTLQIWKFHVDFATPANSTFGTASHTPDFSLAVPTYRWYLCSGSQNCLTQPGTSQGLDPIPDRLMNRLPYRRFADGHESLLANHTVGVGTSGNQAAIRWYEIRNLSTTPTIYQQGTYNPSTDNRWMGSIAMDQSGDIALGYSVSSSTVSPSIRYSGRLAGDPLGTLPQGEATLIAGSGSQTNQFSRWGDYSMMAVDPTDDCTFWYTQEYYTATSDHGWRTRVGSFKFPSCTPPLTISAVQASNINASSAVITWQTSNAADSRVDYGTTATYGSSTSDPTSLKVHSVTLSGLANSTTYHFKATSKDSFGQISSSLDSTFMTSSNSLTNGGFESGAAGWSLAPQASIDTNPADAHSGNNSLKLVATAPWQGSAQFVSVTAGQAYSVSGWGRSSSTGGFITLASFDSSWNVIGPNYDLTFGGSGAWTALAGTYTAPAGAVRVGLVPQSSGAGTFWFDDLSLSPTSNLLVNGGFEVGNAGWSLSPQASIDSNPGDAHSGNNSLKLVATAPWQGSAQFVPVTAGQAYMVSGWGRSNSAGGLITFASFDSNWNVIGPNYDLTFGASGTWTALTGMYTAPAGAVHVGVVTQSSGPGTFWFDDLNLAAR